MVLNALDSTNRPDSSDGRCYACGDDDDARVDCSRTQVAHKSVQTRCGLKEKEKEMEKEEEEEKEMEEEEEEEKNRTLLVCRISACCIPDNALMSSPGILYTLVLL